MTGATRVLVVGQELPFRQELRNHRYIETCFSHGLAEAEAHLDEADVDVCLVTPDFRDQDAVRRIRRRLGPTPCLVLVRSASERAAWPLDAATAVVPLDKIESIVLLLAQHTGIGVARYPRAEIRLPVTAELNGRRHPCVTHDLSISGLRIDDFPKAPLGTQVALVLELEDRCLHLQARLMRWSERDGQRLANLTFIDLQEGPRQLLEQAVQAALESPSDEEGLLELFGDLSLDEVTGRNALSTCDVARSPLPAFLPRTNDLEIPTLRSLLEGDTSSQDVAPWLAQLAADLTRLESAAACGRPAPRWAMDVLKLRINLARVRARFPDRPPPSALIDDAYRMFERLRRKTAGDKGAILEQVRCIRAALLRDVMAAPRTDDVEISIKSA